MGNAGSAHAQQSLQVIARLSGGDVLPLGDPAWAALFAYSQVSRSSCLHADSGAGTGWGMPRGQCLQRCSGKGASAACLPPHEPASEAVACPPALIPSLPLPPFLCPLQPLSRFDPDEVEREIRPHCAELGARGAARCWLAGAGCCRRLVPASCLRRPTLTLLTPLLFLVACATLPCSLQQRAHAQPAAPHPPGGPAAAPRADAGALRAAGDASPCLSPSPHARFRPLSGRLAAPHGMPGRPDPLPCLLGCRRTRCRRSPTPCTACARY